MAACRTLLPGCYGSPISSIPACYRTGRELCRSLTGPTCFMRGCWVGCSARRSGISTHSRLKTTFRPSPLRVIAAVQIASFGVSAYPILAFSDLHRTMPSDVHDHLATADRSWAMRSRTIEFLPFRAVAVVHSRAVGRGARSELDVSRSRQGVQRRARYPECRSG